MNCRKIRFFGVFLLFSAVFSGFGSVSFAGEDYSFENIEVGAESKSPARSRVKAFSKARKEALRQLFTKLKVNIDVDDVKNADIADMVSQERVLNEVISGNSYSGSFDIVFSDNFVQRYITIHDKAIEGQEKVEKLKFLVIPVLMEKGKVIVWEGSNQWRSSLKKAIRDEGVKNFEVIEGDIFNLSVINSTNILRIEPRLIKELFDKYDVDFIYTAFFSYSKENNKAKLAINGFTKRDRFQYRLSFKNSDRLTGPEVKSQVALKLIEYLSNNSLARAQETDQGEDLVKLEIPVRRLSQWIYIKSKLKNSDFINSLDVESVSRDFIKVDILCKDSLDIVRNFEKMGFNLTYRSQGVYLLTIH